MSQTERQRIRDLTYSFWHRAASLARFMTNEEARFCSMIDCDVVEFRDATSKPIALMETAVFSQKRKQHAVTLALAKKANLPAYIVRYLKSESPNPSNNYHGSCPLCGNMPTDSRHLLVSDISKFWVQQITPNPTPFVEYSPDEMAQKILSIHNEAERKA